MAAARGRGLTLGRSPGGHLGAVALVALVLCGALAGHARAQPPPSPTTIFEWRMPSRFGTEHDEKGRVVVPRPDEVRQGPWRVQLQVTAPACAGDAEYRWSVGDEPVEPRRLDACGFEHRFEREGTYPLRLDVTVDGTRLTQTQQVVVQDWLIVSIGDSVASGEAVPDVPDVGDAVWQSVRCHRSARAAPAKAAQRIEDVDDHSSVTFVHLACSGATVPRGLLGPYAGIEPPPDEPALEPQVDALNELVARRPVDAVLVSIGANDVHFGDTVRFCAPPGAHCFTRPFGKAGGGPRRPLQEVIAGSLRELPARYEALDRRISPAIERSRVHVVEYFDPTRDQRGNTCERILGFVTGSELEQARSRLLEPLNDAVVAAAARHGWTAVTGVAPLFQNHGYCAGPAAWVTTFNRSFVGLGGRLRGRVLGTLHPNEAGHEATSEVIAGALGRTLYPGQVLPWPAKPPRPPQPPGTGDGGLSTPAIVAIAAAAVLLLAAGARLVLRKRRA